jgi:archaellum component FlaC
MPQDFFDWLGISGIIALLGGAFGYGQLKHQVNTLEREHKDIKSEVHDGRVLTGQNAVTLARVEERMETVKDDIAEIKAMMLSRLHAGDPKP